MTDITLPWLRARCDEVGDCMVWRGNADNNGRDPRCSLDGKRLYVRRALWELAHARLVPKGYFVGTTCGTTKCVCPDHLALRTRSQALSGHRKKIDTKIRIAQTKRAASSLAQEVVLAIRLDQRPERVVAAERGIHRSTVGLIRRGQTRRDYSSHFAGLMT